MRCRWMLTVSTRLKTSLNCWHSLNSPVVQTDEELQAARACFDENGLEAALRYLENLPEGDPRHQFHRQFFGAQLLEEAGMAFVCMKKFISAGVVPSAFSRNEAPAGTSDSFTSR